MTTTNTTVLGLVLPTPGTGEPYSQVNENANNTKIDSAIGFKTTKITTTTVSNTTTETQLFGVTIVGGSSIAGTVYKAVVWGTYDNSGTSTSATFRVKLGGVTMGTIGIVTPASAQSNQPWAIEFELMCTATGVTGTWRPKMYGEFTPASGPFNDVQIPSAAVTRDTTILNVMEVTVQWTAANAANTVRCDAGYHYRVTNA